MGAILYRFVEIALLRKGPQDLPSTGFLVLLAVLMHLLVALLWVQISAETFYEAGVGEVLNITTLYALAWGLLRFAGHPARLNATLSALVGSDAVISAMAIPVVLWTGTPAAPDEIGSGRMLLIIAVAVWNITVMSNVLRLAAGLSRLAAVAIAVAYALTYIRLFLSVIALRS